jgi:2-oxoglutarate dehydrogenase E2 component (dihydrolipoamide succinyltransferase)
MATGTAFEVVMPQMGVSVSEGTVTKWLKNVGDTVASDETLLEISTDKVDTEVPSPGSGVLQEILVQEGETVAVGTVIARIGPASDAVPESASPPPEPAAPEAEAPEPEASPPPPDVAGAQAQAGDEAADDEYEDVTPTSPRPSQPDEAPPAAGTSGNGSGARHTFVSPVVARIAAEHGIDPATVPGTGRDGRVTKSDILAFVEAGGASPAPEPPKPAVSLPPPLPAEASTPATPAPPSVSPPVPAPAAPAPAPVAAPAPPAAPPRPVSPAPPAQPGELEPGETLTPMTAMRRGIANHMRHSLDTAAHVTSAIEVDMSRVVGLREKLKREYQSSYGVNPTYLAFIARATVETLRDWPLVNAEIRGESIVQRSHANLGFAVALDEGKGLIVPVLKHAEGLNLLGMARGIADLAARARTKKLLPDDVQGGTFSITNPGSYGTFMGTPIINQPQTAILGTYAVVKRPWVITDDAGKDAIAIRPMMNLTLTYDHRLVDGAYGGQVLRDLADRLQNWGESDY